MPAKKTSAPPQPKKPRAAATKSLPTREEISLRAYQIYLERNGGPGNPFEDWTRAERELLAGAPKPRRKPSPKTQAA
ncbi:MAG: DUF2934 domain-containing protein [Candidatus Acidiferrum sp.]|jgi:hypothetical protein